MAVLIDNHDVSSEAITKSPNTNVTSITTTATATELAEDSLAASIATTTVLVSSAAIIGTSNKDNENDNDTDENSNDIDYKNQSLHTIDEASVHSSFLSQNSATASVIATHRDHKNIEKKRCRK